ncbi:MAG: hypothetical protein V2G42_04780 [bacterium JZ-2024 1]
MMKMGYRAAMTVAVVLAAAALSIISTSSAPSPKAFGLDAVRAHGLFTSNDPLATRLLLLNDAIGEYASMRGQFVSPSDMANSGWLPFVLSNAYARKPMSNSCHGPSAGDYCFALNSPYDISSFKVYDSSGSPIANIFWEFTTIHPDRRDRPNGVVYQAVSQSGLSEADQRLIFTAQVLGSRLLQTIQANGGVWNAVSDAFSAEPYNQFKDPVSGNLLSFAGDGYGNRITFSSSRGGSRVRMQVNGSSGGPIYEADFGSLNEAGESGSFRIVFSPLPSGMTASENLPAVLPWQDGGNGSCAGSAVASTFVPESDSTSLASTIFSPFSSRVAFAIPPCYACVTVDCCMPPGSPSCEICGNRVCCEVTVNPGCNCPQGQCCLNYVCGNITYNKCVGGG